MSGSQSGLTRRFTLTNLSNEQKATWKILIPFESKSQRSRKLLQRKVLSCGIELHAIADRTGRAERSREWVDINREPNHP